MDKGDSWHLNQKQLWNLRENILKAVSETGKLFDISA